MKLKLIFIVIFLLSFNSCDEKKVRVIKLGHGLDINHSVHKAMVRMKHDLEIISNGRMSIQIYPNQQLGTERESLELLQIGSLDMTKVSVGVMENFSPKMKVFGFPFLFKDREHAFQVLDGPIGRELLGASKRFRLVGLGYYDAGSRSFYTKSKPINTPKDLKGLKIRVMESATAIEMIRELGGSPTPISWGELYTSLQQGVVDGAENNPPSFFLSRHYEVCKFYSLDEHTTLPDILVIGLDSWNRLTSIERVWLQQAVDKSVKYQRELWAEAEKTALESVIKAGVKIIKPKKENFIKEIQKFYESYGKDEGISQLIFEIQKQGYVNEETSR